MFGYLVEAITDTAFAEYCQKHIFIPLSMNETSWFLANLDSSHVARPYQWTSSEFKPYPHWGFPVYPAGQLRTSSMQLSRFLSAFMQKGTLGDTRILDSSTVALMTTAHYPKIPLPWQISQGLIWYQVYSDDRLVWGHSGGFGGALTVMNYYEREKSGVIVLTNCDQFQVAGGVSTIRSALFDYAATIPTGLAESDEILLDGYALRQNYPNPFNPSTTIEFALPKAGFVTLKIYNLLGQEVATLVAEKLPVGKHQRVWEAKGLASGVYLYHLEAGDPSTVSTSSSQASSCRGFVQTKKLILLM